MSEVMCIHCPAVVKETDATCVSCGGQLKDKEQGNLMNNLTGKTYPTKAYGTLEIIKYINSYTVNVRFVETGYETVTRMTHIRNGSVRDPFHKSVIGVGFVGEGEFNANVNRKSTNAYRCWHSMLKRCYSELAHKTQPTYIGCTVCPEWHNFQNFAKWYYKNYPSDGNKYDLDKDIKIHNNKEYSPNACMFVSHEENTIKAHAKNYVFKNPHGDIVDIYNLEKFCKENSLNSGGMNQVHSGKLDSHKGWTKSELTPSVRSNVLRWLVDQHKLDYHNCPTRLITHDYALKLATHLDEVAGKVNNE